MSWLTCGDGFVAVQIVARPGTSRRGIIRIDPRGLVVALKSPPEKGKANDELVDFLARMLKIPRSSVAIAHGSGGRHKTVRIATHNPGTLALVLETLAAALSN